MTNLPTITAIATASGRGGIGVIRLSGNNAHKIACELSQRTKPFQSRYAHFCRFYQADKTLIDEGLILYFPAPNSFTGEDVIEIQGHGSPILQNLLLARLYELGAKQATAGEFSYRAFNNDKLDLVQAEAIADAIDATSEASALSAIRSLTGEFSQLINELLEKLIHLRLYVEASIDFPDEEDVDFLSDGIIEGKLTDIQQQLNAILATAKQGQLLRDGIHVVIAGRPNAGKSSLLNRLAGQERAIVTDIAGTTRDTLQETIILNGLTLHLTDTAGLRETSDKVEKMGIERAKQAIEQADILLMVHDLQQQESPMNLAKQLFGEQIVDEKQAKRLLIVGNKLDLATENNLESDSDNIINVSCATGEGIEKLIEILCEKVNYQPSENTLIARTRHLDALKRTQNHVNQAYEQLTVFQAGELVAESLRLAQNDLGEITGDFTADDLLGKIFGSFCIGK